MNQTITCLPVAYTEQQAAEILSEKGWEISTSTLARERKRGNIAFHIIANKVKYTDAQLTAYIGSHEQCPTNSKSESIGSHSKEEAHTGMPHGGPPDEQSVLRLLKRVRNPV